MGATVKSITGQVLSLDPSYTFTVTGNRALTAVFESLSPKEYDYTGDVVEVTLYPGLYKLEVWGAEGGYRSGTAYAGKGGYSVGTISISEVTTAFVRAGGSGNTGKTSGGFNGGGRRGTYNGGGGASDIRIGTDDLNHRVIVAGGGGSDGAATKAGGYGGGTAGQSRTESYGTGGFGGTQTGVSESSWQAVAPSADTASKEGAYGGFGFGGNGISSGGGHGGAGGGGWYGGSGSMPDGSGDDDRGGGGGSGFVWTGANAPTGFGLTEAHCLTNAQTVDGAQSFASPTGATETGHSGNGYVRITPVAFYMVTVVSEDAAKGTVSGGGQYENGAQATVSASPATGYKLSGWYENGVQVSTDKSYSFTVNGNRSLTARFEEVPVYTITATIDPAGSGTVTGAGQYAEGETVALVATAGDGYEFSGWRENGATVSTETEYSFTAAADRAFVAAFEVKVVRLPAGYQELEYVDFNGSTYIYPGLLDYFTYYGYELVVELLPNSNNGTFAGQYGRSAYTMLSSTYYRYNDRRIYYYDDKIVTTSYACDSRTGYITKTASLAKQSGKMVISWDLNSKTFSINDKTTTYTPDITTNLTTVPTAMIGGYLYQNKPTPTGSTTTKATDLMAFRFYEMKTYDGNGNLYNHLVPCRRVSDNVVGLYDIARSKFTTSYPNNALIPGPDV